MNTDLESRRKQLQKLGDFIVEARKEILDVAKELQWDIKSLEEKEEMACCPFDDGHVVPKSSLPDHVERCKLSTQSYHPEDVQFPPLSIDSNALSVIKVDKELQASILRQAKAINPAMLTGFPGAVDDRDVPLTSDRFMSSLTSDERAAIHSFVISNTVSSGEGKDISLVEQDLEKNFQNKKEEKRDKTPLERLIEERDAKRRKEGKKVHINRKSHTEIIREVIENQMEVYVEWLKDQNMIKTEEEEPDRMKKSGNLSEGEVSELDVKQENEDVSCHAPDDMKSFVYDERKQRSWESGESLRGYQRRDQNECSESWGRNYSQKSRDSRSKYHHSSESGSKQYWEKDSASYRGSERKSSKDHDYKKYGGNQKDSYARLKTIKHSSEKYWDGGAHVLKFASSDEETERDRKGRKRHGEKTDVKKREREKRQHKSKRRRHGSDSDCDSKTKYKKDQDYRKND